MTSVFLLSSAFVFLDHKDVDPDVTIVEIGPFTNLALAIRLVPKLLKQAHIVVIGCAGGAVYPEWNILCDPQAANILLQ